MGTRTAYQWASRYYSDYISRYRYDSQPRDQYILDLVSRATKLKLSHTNSTSCTLHLLDIGAGDWRAFTQGKGNWIDSLASLLHEQHSVDLHIHAVDPWFDNSNAPKGSSSNGRAKCYVIGYQNTITEYLAGISQSAPKYDLIMSYHGLYGMLEELNLSIPDRQARLDSARKQLEALLDLLSKPNGLFAVVHSSRDSAEKSLKFNPQSACLHKASEAARAHLARFKDTHAEALLECVRGSCPLHYTPGGAILDLDISDDGFAEYYFRLPTGTDLHNELCRLLYESLSPDGSVKVQIATRYFDLRMFRTLRGALNWEADVTGSFAASEPRPLSPIKYYDARTERLIERLYWAMPDCEDLHVSFVRETGGREGFAQVGHLIDAVRAQVAPERSASSIIYPLIFNLDRLQPLKEPRYPTIMTPSAARSPVSPFSFVVTGAADIQSSDIVLPTIPAYNEVRKAVDNLAASLHDALNTFWLTAPDSQHALLQARGDAVSGVNLAKIGKHESDLYGRYKNEWLSAIAEANSWKNFSRTFFFEPHIRTMDQFARYAWLRALLLMEIPAGRISVFPAWRPSQACVGSVWFFVYSTFHSEEHDLVEHFCRGIDSFVHESDRRSAELAATEKTARAAIMSRNLSHNLGSHALANPAIFKAVGVLGEQSEAPSVDAEYDVLSYTHADLMRHEQSRRRAPTRCPACGEDRVPPGDIIRDANGSPILAPDGRHVELPVLKGEAWRARARLSELHSYLQARLDFIARALGETDSMPEPMLFLADLLKGFLSQTVLLNTLFSDNGYEAKDISISITFPGGERVTYRGHTPDHELRHVRFILEENGGKGKDALISLPGGMVGRHAFYALLENILRNAVKYGERSIARSLNSEKELAVSIHLQEAEAAGAFILQISDNLSVCQSGSGNNGESRLVDSIREHLNRDLVDKDTGRTQKEGHGIQEMKLCAEFLAGGSGSPLVFRADGDAPGLGVRVGDEYDAYAKKTGCPVGRALPLACHVARDDSLVYSLLLPKPCLVCVVDGGGTKVDGVQDGVAIVPEISQMVQKSPHIGIIVGGESPDQDILKYLAARHLSLPYRLIISAPSQAGKAAWRSSIGSLVEAGELPARRIKVVADGRGASSWTAMEALESWTGVYKEECLKEGGKWNLAIGFERSAQYVRDRWVVNGRLGFESKVIRLWLASGSGRESSWYCSDAKDPLNSSREEFQRTTSPANQLVLANHGMVIDKSYGTHAYHAFSGSEQIDLFQLLDSPPADELSRAFLIHGVVEAMLTNVVVVDERVADACIEDLRGGELKAYGEQLFKKQRARIFPVYGMACINQERRSLSTRARDAMDREGLTAQQKEAEGLRLHSSEKHPLIRTYVECATGLRGLDMAGIDAPDVVIIHEGVTDVMRGHGWKQGDHRGLYKICPMVVRTSGRGSDSRNIGNELPFYEFSELNECVYRQMNKVALVRGLLALRGSTRG